MEEQQRRTKMTTAFFLLGFQGHKHIHKTSPIQIHLSHELREEHDYTE